MRPVETDENEWVIVDSDLNILADYPEALIALGRLWMHVDGVRRVWVMHRDNWEHADRGKDARRQIKAKLSLGDFGVGSQF